MNFREKIQPIAIRNKFWFSIKNMNDQDILDFLKEDIFECDDFNLPFEDAKKNCEKSLGKSLDKLISLDDQKELYRILREHIF